MNCKPGDLAYIVVPADFCDKFLDGKFVTVGVAGQCDLGTFPDPRWGAAWLCKFHLQWFSDRTQSMVSQCYINDAWLRPIRDPGEDARDETLTWLSVPTREGIPA